MKRMIIGVVTLLMLGFPLAGISQYKAEDVIKERYVSIDNVCAWPNLTKLADGTIVAMVFNKPSHGLLEGDIECWASADGRFWKKQGVPAQHDVNAANRMHVAAGLAKNGDVLAIASGFTIANYGTKNPNYGTILRAWISRSTDGGKTWAVDKASFPKHEGGESEFIPYGDIVVANDGSLRATCYARSKVYMLRSDDDGYTWNLMSKMSDGHNEVAIFQVDSQNWLAAVRTPGNTLDLMQSTDDGKTWTLRENFTQKGKIPAHFLKLGSGELVITYGNRVDGSYGIEARVSTDSGKSWGEPIALVDDFSFSDGGYPSSVQLDNGEIVTSYYTKGITGHNRYHMGTIIWEFPKR